MQNLVTLAAMGANSVSPTGKPPLINYRYTLLLILYIFFFLEGGGLSRSHDFRLIKVDG